MAQAKEGHTEAADVVGDYDAICRVLQLCTEGEAKGDVAKLREAFHADARMFGSLAGTRYDVPIAELFALAESAPADTGNYRSRVLSVQQTGEAAVGVVAEEGYWGRSPSSTTSCSRASTGPGRSCASCSPTPAGSRPRGSESPRFYPDGRLAVRHLSLLPGQAPPKERLPFLPFSLPVVGNAECRETVPGKADSRKPEAKRRTEVQPDYGG